MSRNTLPIYALLLLACNGVPSRPLPGDYQPEALTVHARFQGLPADADQARLLLYWVNGYEKSVTQVATDIDIPLSAEEAEFRVPATGAYGSTDYLFSTLRIFMVRAVVFRPYEPSLANAIYPGVWEEPGRLLVYADHATFWTPLGPTGPTLNFPAGYSWLRRRCGTSPGQLAMEVRPIDEVVDFRHQDDTYGDEPDLDASERALLESCGATTPPDDLGVRASFDVAASLAWSPDGTTIYYLSRPDEQDKTQTAGLRQVRLLDTSTSELTTIAKTKNVQVGKPGHLFVSTSDSLLHVTLAPTITAVPLPNVGASSGLVSPDGRWLAYSDGRTHIIDLETGAPLAGFDGPSGSPHRWSNDGRLAYWVLDEAQPTLNIISPAVPGAVPTAYPVEQGIMTGAVWTNGGVMLTKMPLTAPWIVDETTLYVGGFTLTLVDPNTGIDRPVLDASTGMVWPVELTTVPNKAFVWATKCLGPWTTVCSSALLRIDAIQATVETVATSPAAVRVALSPDGRRLALGTAKGIYVKELAQ